MIFRHSFLNLVGLGSPLISAVFTIRILESSLGDERLGLLVLIWAVVSYFGLFDLGRALTLQLSRYLATDRES